MDARDRILVIKLGAFGDFVQAFGPMRAIRRHHPDAHITLLTTKPFAELAHACGLFDSILFDPRPTWYQPAAWVALKRQLNGGKFKRVYDLQNSDRTALYFKLFSPKPEWVGAAKGASHENASPLRSAGHAFEGHQQTLALAGITDVSIDDLSWMTAETARFDLPALYVLVVPGASPKRPLKRWPADHYGMLCRQLHEAGYTPVIIGAAADAHIAAAIKETCANAIDLTGRTQMTDIPALARNAAFAVGNDTGPIHMIAPTGCKTLVLFSKDSNPVKHKPLGAQVYTMTKDDLAGLAPESVMDYLQRESFLRA